MTNVLVSALAACVLTAAVAAHPGHDEVKLLVGEIVRADDRGVTVEYLDSAAMERKSVALVVDERTKWTLAKKRVARFALPPGQRVEVLTKLEDLPGGRMHTHAVEIKVKKLMAAAR